MRCSLSLLLLGAVSCLSLHVEAFSQFSSLHNFRVMNRILKRTSAISTLKAAVQYEVDSKGRQRLQLREQGWYKWNWEGTEKSRGPYEINYVKAGEKGVPIVLVHGFGAHAFHWRYQIPALSEKYRVYSLCLLGYGWSPKVVTPYSGELWGAQVADFGKALSPYCASSSSLLTLEALPRCSARSCWGARSYLRQFHRRTCGAVRRCRRP